MTANTNKTSVALGMFDGVHIGHVEVIKSALAQQDLTPAVFTFRRLNMKNTYEKYGEGEGCIIPYQMKFTLLKAAGIKTVYSSDFDSVRDLSAEDFVRQILIEKMNCAHVSCGWNFKFSKGAKADADDLKRICGAEGIGVRIIPPFSVEKGVPVSSTRIREAIRAGDIALANKMLGRLLSYELEVIEGEKLGRKLGAPTINQYIPDGCVLPRFGVYRSVATVDSQSYTAVTNIGIKPTVDGVTPVMETHITGFGTDVYGQTVEVGLAEFMRDEKKYGSIEELKKQILIDIEYAVKKGCSK